MSKNYGDSETLEPELRMTANDALRSITILMGKAGANFDLSLRELDMESWVLGWVTNEPAEAAPLVSVVLRWHISKLLEEQGL